MNIIDDWKEIPNWNEYQVNTQGLVRVDPNSGHHNPGRILKPTKKTKSYCYSLKRMGGRQHTVALSKIYNAAFGKSPMLERGWFETVCQIVKEQDARARPVSNEVRDNVFNPMWDWKKYACPWLTWQIYCANEGEVTESQINPII